MTKKQKEAQAAAEAATAEADEDVNADEGAVKNESEEGKSTTSSTCPPSSTIPLPPSSPHSLSPTQNPVTTPTHAPSPPSTSASRFANANLEGKDRSIPFISTMLGVSATFPPGYRFPADASEDEIWKAHSHEITVEQWRSWKLQNNYEDDRADTPVTAAP
jgi:hypothetical protein